MIVRERTPASRLASGLMPTASIEHAQRRAPGEQRGGAKTASAIRKAIGRVRKNPDARPLKVPLLTVVIWPSVTSIARPRPATIRTSVAMIGWMPRTETRKPFQSAEQHADREGRGAGGDRGAGAPGRGLSKMRAHAKAAAIAAIAPTERSMPRVAITRVMPIATSRIGALLRTMSTRLPKRWPSWMRMSKNDGVGDQVDRRAAPPARARATAAGGWQRSRRRAGSGSRLSAFGACRWPSGSRCGPGPR